MAEPNASESSATRRIKWLGVGVVAVIALYSGVWMFLAWRLDRTVADVLAQAEASGTTVECERRDVRGYPFRLGVHCASVALAGEGVRATAGELRTAAQVYDPGRVIAELDGPLQYAGPAGDGTATWSAMRASGRFGLEELNLGTVTADDIDWRGSVNGSQIAATIDRVVASVRPNGADLDVALTVDALDPSPVEGHDAPPLDMRLDATVSGAAGALAYGAVPVESLRGRTVTVRTLDLALRGGGRLAATGEVAVDGDGLATGTVELGFSNLAATVGAAAALVPEYAGPLQAFAQVAGGGDGAGLLGGLLGYRSADPQPESGLRTLTVTLERGQASLGIIPLVRVPPLP